ncbi:major facilitator superfamily MFS_1 [Rubrobacter xylanophilus DSM 9941]|uniref:Putative proline/betaine transporter n=1 Tax=Rubrobacter xylanophilus (strain DSM 9941 / JCM 11954 / NBRC 16129 / PRD-1) TaxID=266117 RepID=Q1AVM9_RUBXD|nr:major facilitator superfamily MFS_1 [Rubrobacter xylanophilus DSM 9941]
MERMEARLGGEDIHPPTSIRKVAFASFIGSTVEWYDFFIYGTATALVFGQLFFPSANPLASTLAAFATFGVGFLFRPLGGAFFGHFGDRIGRKAMLVITLLVMGTATVLIGFLPTYAQVGVLAPVLLVTLRAIQGFSVGGEWAGGSLMVIEHAPPGRRGFYGAFPQIGPSAGTLLSAGVFAIVSALPEEQFLSWGWRIPFILSAIVVAVGLFIRLRIAESPIFERVKETRTEARMPIVDVFRAYGKNIVLIMGMRLAINTIYYGATVYALSYATEQLGIANSTMLTMILITAAIGFVSKPVYGAISDMIGRRPIYFAGAIVGALISFPFFWALETRSIILIFLAYVVAINVAHNLIDAIEASFYPELFGTRTRYSGAALGHQLGAAITGFTPLIAGALSAAGGWPLVAGYFTVACLVSVVCVYLATETFRKDIAEMESTEQQIAAEPRVQ